MLFYQAGQAALKAYDKATKVIVERERYRTDRDYFRQKWRTSEQHAKNAEAEVEKLKKELADAKAASEIAEAAMKRMEVEENEKMKIADANGYEARIKRAAIEYTQIAHKMVNDELEARMPDFYKLRLCCWGRRNGRGDGDTARVRVPEAAPRANHS